ncbi:MAG: endoribonuclease MazF [Oscillatoria sp. PMC 1068.18]|nr:endoribonuclease MazF [Oscillatoria sp. PMC 1068.18]
MKINTYDLYIPQRGDIIWLNFSPQSGREQAGRRPALVISPSSYNRRVKLAIVCPITTKIKGYPFEVQIPEGLPVSGVILADQIKSLDWGTRRTEFSCNLPTEVLIEVVNVVTELLTGILS